MGLNVADAKVNHCQTAAEVRALARAVLERKRARNRPRKYKIPINDLTPGSFPVVVIKVEPPPLAAFEPEMLQAEAPEPIRFPTIASIIDLVCRVYGIAKMDLLSHRRTLDIVLPRQVAQALAVRLTPHSLPAIGKHFGNRDHTTILSSKRKIERLRAADPDFDRAMLDLESRLGGHNPQIKIYSARLTWSEAMDARLKELIATSKSWKNITKTMEREFRLHLAPTACYGRMYTLGLRRPKVAPQPLISVAA